MTVRFVLGLFCICIAAAHQVLQKPFIEILKSESAGPDSDGSYSFSFEDSAGGKRVEVGQVIDPDIFVVQGVYSYTSDDGSIVEVQYRADDRGFHVESPVLPKAPPMPPHAVEQMKIAEEQRKRGVVFDQRGFLVEKNRL